MKTLYKVEDMVKKILEDNPKARDDDFLLICEVYQNIDDSLVDKSFKDVMINHKKNRLPYFESIRRTRQRLQAKYNNLRASEEVETARINKTSDYINYAIDGYQTTFKDFIGE